MGAVYVPGDLQEKLEPMVHFDKHNYPTYSSIIMCVVESKLIVSPFKQIRYAAVGRWLVWRSASHFTLMSRIVALCIFLLHAEYNNIACVAQ